VRRSLAAALAVTVAIGVLATARAASAHPAGFTSVNRYVGVSGDAQGAVHLAYLIDFAELPAYAEIEQLDADHDGAVSPAEQRAYLDRRVPPLVARWTIEIDGVKVEPRVTGSSLEAPPGERGLSTLRIAADVVAEPPAAIDLGGRDLEVRVVDPAFAERSGWREMAAEESADLAIVSGPSAQGGGILAYSSARPEGPPRVDEARFVFRLRAIAAAPIPPSRPGASLPIDPRLARLSEAMRRAEGRPGFAVLALALAFALGAAHALSPGHGKALAAAYLVGRRARPAQAVVFGLAVTVAHTTVVFLMGALALAVERTVGSDRLLRFLEVGSALAVVGLGIVQLSRRWREVAGQGPDHVHHLPGGEVDGVRSLVALGTSSGIAPCPSALALLLAAIALHRYGFGLVLVLGFSAGVATTLTAAGLLVVLARRLLDRVAGASPLLRWLPVMSSMCVLLLGILLCASAWFPSVPRPW
jgi:ABC-type nickel/cobalt efflux system permease component RcnA